MLEVWDFEANYRHKEVYLSREAAINNFPWYFFVIVIRFKIMYMEDHSLCNKTFTTISFGGNGKNV